FASIACVTALGRGGPVCPPRRQQSPAGADTPVRPYPRGGPPNPEYSCHPERSEGSTIPSRPLRKQHGRLSEILRCAQDDRKCRCTRRSRARRRLTKRFSRLFTKNRYI